MNYNKIYYSIIENRLKNPIKNENIYTEKHHIKPVSFFKKGTSKKDIDENNIVVLTSREHFICHCLLVKMYKIGSYKWEKMNYALINMKGNNKYHKNSRYFNSRLYEYYKITFSKNRHLTKKYKRDVKNGLSKINELCDWIDVNGLPKIKSENKIEKSFGYKIASLKEAKHGKNDHLFVKEFQDLIVSRGYPDLFNTPFENNLKKINEICDWIDVNGRFPKNHIKGKEGNYARKISTLKMAKKNKGSNWKFNEKYQQLVEDRGYGDLF